MKMLFKIKRIKAAAAFTLMVSLLTLVTACDKLPFFKNSAEEGTQGPGIVQTDWKSNDAADREAALQDGKTEGNLTGQPVKLAEVSEAKHPQKGDAAVIAAADDEAAEFAVQIGAFLVADNATRLVEKLKKKGYQPNVTVVTTPAKKWSLVRIGAYPDKKSALDAARKFTATEKMETAVVKDRIIIKMQTSADVNQPAEKVTEVTEPDRQTTVAKFEPEKFTFQVGGLRTQTNAAEYANLLKKQGYKPYIQKAKSLHSGESWYSVRIGTFDNIDLAAEAAAEFAARESIPTMAVSVNN